MSESLTRFRLERKYRTRIFVFSGFIFAAGFVLLARLTDLQLVHGVTYRIQAKKFVSRQEFTRAPRGLIYDRNFTLDPQKSLLVKNYIYVDFVIYPSRFRNRASGLLYIKRFCMVMGVDCSKYSRALKKSSWNNLVRRNKPLVLINRLSRRERERLSDFNVIARKGRFISRHLRYYVMGPALAHVTGYVGLPSRRELTRKKALSYQLIGKAGLEQVYDSQLRGADGVRIRHKIIDAEEQIAVSAQGNNLVLTIDKNVQAAAYRALVKTKKRGVVIAIKAATGEILAMATTYTYDPNILSSGSGKIRSRHIRLIRKYKAFLNPAIQTKFPPGSTFKPLVALSALESQGRFPVNESTSFTCRGKWRLKSTLPGVPDSEYYCWEHGGHGHPDLITAIAKSCSVYFYQLGYKIGPRRIINFSRAFGLDKKTGIDLPGEIAGFVPDDRWKRLHLSSRWYDGDTVNLSIGQGFLEVTPLENAVMFAALANRGKIYRPILVREIREPESNRVLRSFQSELIREVPVLPGNLELVQRGMREVFKRGTASYLNLKDLPIAGKSGTVQTRSKRNAVTHAWFVAYAPYGGKPEDIVVVSVFVEHGGGGSATAAPIAQEVLKAAFPPEARKKFVLKTEADGEGGTGR